MSRRLATLLTVLAALAVASGAWLTFMHGDEVRGHTPSLSAPAQAGTCGQTAFFATFGDNTQVDDGANTVDDPDSAASARLAARPSPVSSIPPHHTGTPLAAQFARCSGVGPFPQGSTSNQCSSLTGGS